MLGERLQSWKEGKFKKLLRDTKIIQKKITTSTRRPQEDISRIFSKLVFEGKLSNALKFLDDNTENLVLKPTEEVINKLKKLHPPPADILPDSLIQGPMDEPSPAVFNSITEDQIMRAAKQVTGSGGPSQTDAKQWKRILVSKHYKKEGKDLREELANFAKKIATEIVDPKTLEAYTACRLLSLNKAPGETELQIRPIGVGEVLRRIVGKTIAWALSEDIQEAGGALQVSTGLKGGAEAAIHGMKNIFEAESTDAIILVDAENAFNKLNRQVALHNIQHLCPNFATVLINTYRLPSRLFLVGGGEILSTEGTTQGDTLAMPFYGISTRPLINKLNHLTSQVHQVWLADDATGAGTLTNLKNWWIMVTEEGRKYGYIVKPSKSWLILKNQERLEEAEALFADTPIKITTDGKRHLGAALGTVDFKNSYLEEMVQNWCKRLKNLVKFAKTQPHAAYSSYIMGEQHKYTYFLRTLDDIADLLKPLDDIIEHEFLPALFGKTISPNEREIMSLPIRDGGLGLRVLSQTSSQAYVASKNINKPLTNQIMSQNQDLPTPEEVKEAKTSAHAVLKEIADEKHSTIISKQTTEMKRTLEQLSEPGASSWVGALPLKEHAFNLNKSEFNDAMCLRYEKPLSNLPSKCACLKDFSITHAMNCKRGGFIGIRHDSIKNFEAGLLKQVCKDVQTEPHLQPVGNAKFKPSVNTEDGARLDVRARSFWRDGQQAFFDVRLTNADCESQKDKPLKSILRNHEQMKKTEYNTRVMEVEQGTFTPIVLTIKGVMGPETTQYHKALAQKISQKSGERYEDITRLIRVKISFLVLRASLLCLRGSRTLSNNNNAENCEDYALTLHEIGMR